MRPVQSPPEISKGVAVERKRSQLGRYARLRARLMATKQVRIKEQSIAGTT